MSNYLELQQTIDKVIGKIGLENTKTLLDGFINNTEIKQTERDKIAMISHYLVSSAVKVFELKEELFYTSRVREYRDARMCCFHLLRQYTQDSFPKIGLFFNQKARIVMYGFFVLEDHLAMPKGNSKLVAKYRLLQSLLVEFIGKIN